MPESSEHPACGAPAGHHAFADGAAAEGSNDFRAALDGIPRKHSPGAIALALIPFAAMCFSVPLWDRIVPVVLGLPFNLFWLTSWEVLTALCLWLAYRLETAQAPRAGEGG